MGDAVRRDDEAVMKTIKRFRGTWSSFVVVQRYNGKFAVEQHFDHGDENGGDGFVIHGVYTAKYKAMELAEQLAKHS